MTGSGPLCCLGGADANESRREQCSKLNLFTYAQISYSFYRCYHSVLISQDKEHIHQRFYPAALEYIFEKVLTFLKDDA